MKTFTNLTDMMKDFESFTPVARINEIDGNWEVGYGFNFADSKHVVEGMTMTQEEADRIFLVKIDRLTDLAKRKCENENMSFNEYDAIVSLMYNMGETSCPKLMLYCNLKDTTQASFEILNGIYCKDKPVLGLLRRRISEYRLFTKGMYCRFEEGDPVTVQEYKMLQKMNWNSDEAWKMIHGLPLKES